MKHSRIAPRLALALAVCSSLAPFAARADGMPSDADPATKVHPMAAKPGLGVRMSYTLAAVTVGSPSVLVVTLGGRHAGDATTVTFRPDVALALTSSDLVVGEPKALGEGGNVFSLQVTPQSEGLHYVNVFVQSGRRSQALAIPVQAGEGTKLKSAAKVQSSANGERVISVPAKQ